jgi:nitroreductase
MTIKPLHDRCHREKACFGISLYRGFLHLKKNSMTTLTIPEALSVILRRASVRNYTGRTIDKANIERILRAGMAAPAAVHQFPWKFIVIRNKEMLAYLASGLPFAKMLAEAGTAIVVCAVPHEAFAGRPEYAVLACACASENILLAAEALGLGAVWTAVYPNADLMEFVREELNIPADVIPLNIIPIGYPSGEDMACDKYDPANIHWEQW